MNDYSIALFAHIVGTLGFFVALGVEWLSLRRLRNATNTEQVHEWLRIGAGARRWGGVAMAIIVVAGFYMMAIAHIGAAWLMVALASIILLMVLAMGLTGRRLAAIQRTVSAASEPVSPTLHHLLHDSLLWFSMQTRVGIALGIVFLMTVKPDLVGSLLTIGIATLLGLAYAASSADTRKASRVIG